MVTPKQFANSGHSYVEAPAGCGKTELICNAVNEASGCQLVLTHTHAGVHAIRARMKKLGVPSLKYHLETIAGWALRIGFSYPRTCGIKPEEDRYNFSKAYPAACRFLSLNAGKIILQCSYSGVFIDEYQDCSKAQHQLVLVICETLPVRLVGDPLQQIYNFDKEDPAIDWHIEVASTFHKCGELTTPWRWKGQNEELGEWLLYMRNQMLTAPQINLADVPTSVTSKPLFTKRPFITQRAECFSMLKRAGGVIALHKFPHQAHSVAKNMAGVFNSMDEMYSNELEKFIASLNDDPASNVNSTLNFSTTCFSNAATILGTIIKKTRAKDFDFSRMKNHQELTQSISRILNTDNLYLSVCNTLGLIRDTKGINHHRRDLLSDTIRVLTLLGSKGDDESVSDVLWCYQHQRSLQGRRLSKNMVSRVLLVKGLEFKSTLLLSANELSTNELYVGLTRPSIHLGILYNNNIFNC